jgi:hypothetical protein
MTRFSLAMAMLGILGAALAPRPAAAQRFGFGSRSNSLVGLAANQAVQKELAIDEDAAARLDKLNDAYRSAAQKELASLGIDYGALGDLPAAERAAEMRRASERTAEVTRKLTAEFLPQLADVLKPEAIERLKQIQLQASGAEMWIEPPIADVLKLTADQQQRLRKLRDDTARRQQQLDGDFQQRLARTRELTAARDAQSLDLLTAAQKAKISDLQGPPFDTSQLTFSRRRGKQ